MSSLGLELIKNINIEEHNNQTNNFNEKPHVQFKETNEIIEPSESSQVDSTTIINNENPMFNKQPINETENNIINNATKIEHQQNIPQQEQYQENSIEITNNKTQSTNKQLIQKHQQSNKQTELKPSLKENTQIIKSEQLTSYNKYIPNMQSIIFVVALVVIVFVIYKYINANTKLLETKLIELQEKQKMFKTE